eukprot:scaffold95955_cov58-Attheya_sp.AAC.5
MLAKVWRGNDDGRRGNHDICRTASSKTRSKKITTDSSTNSSLFGDAISCGDMSSSFTKEDSFCGWEHHTARGRWSCHCDRNNDKTSFGIDT